MKNVENGLHSASQGNYHLHELDKKKEVATKEVHIYIVKDQLLYDIDAQSLIVARARRNGNNVDQHNVSTDEADQFRPMFERWIDKYFSLAMNRMQAYVKTEPRIAMTNNLKQWTEKDITLSMPDYWNEKAFEPLKSAIHDYIVNGVLYEFFTLNLTAKDPVTVSKHDEMQNSYADIKNHISAYIPGTIHKPMHPFGVL